MPHGLHGWGGGSSSLFGLYGKTRNKYAIPAFYVVLLGCFLSLLCATPAVVESDSGVGSDFPSRQQQQAVYSTLLKADNTREEPTSTEHFGSNPNSFHLQRGPEPEADGAEGDAAEDGGRAKDDNETPEVFVRARQTQFTPGGTKWVELRVEVLGSDGKINKRYSGGVAASLILADSGETAVRSQEANLENQKGLTLTSERAVSIASNAATDGVAVLHFSPPTDGMYRFSITCGGCNHKLNTEKHYFSAGTNAALKVVSQPSGASSGAILEYQPAVQLEDREGRPLQVKSTIVASVLPIDAHTTEGAPLDSWTLETDDFGYAKANGIRVTKAGQHIIQFVTTLWQDTRLEVSSASFEVVPGPASAASFSLRPPSRVLPHEPFSVVAVLVDSYGNETASPPKLQGKGNSVEVHLSAFNKAGLNVPLHGNTRQVTCTLCAQDTPSSSAEIQVASASRVHVDHMPVLVERRVAGDGDGVMPSREYWGQLRISLKAEDWSLGAPRKPVSVEVRDISLLAPLRGLTREDGAKYLRVEPTRIVFSVENATYPQVIYVLPWSPGVTVGSEGLSQPLSGIHIGAFSIELDVVSEDPSWSSTVVVFDLPSPALAPGVSLSFFPGPKDVTVYAKDSDTKEVLIGFPQQQLVREGERIAYTLRLSSCPLEDEEVEVRIHGDSSGGYSVQPEVLRFTASNWQQGQTVSLKVDQDDIAPSGDELSFEGSITGNAIRTLVLHHQVSTSEKDHAWCIRGGKDVTFSVWDDDTAGVSWKANSDYLVESEHFKLAFRLRSQPVADVSLQLSCEGTEIIGQLKSDHALDGTSPQSKLNEGGDLGKIVVQPAHWQTEYEFLLRVKSTAEGSDRMVVESSAHDAILHTSCSLKATSNDPNYNTGENPTGQQHLLLGLRGFGIPLAISRISSQSLADDHRSGQATAASIVTCVGAHYLRTANRIVECLPCPPGHECPDPAEPPKPCPPEHMSLGGFPYCVPCPEEGKDVRINANAAMPCPEGFYCAGGSASPAPCLPGYVSGTGASECFPCPAGFKCNTGRATDLEACPKGSYSLRGELACRPCPAGFACTVQRGGGAKVSGDEPTAFGLSDGRAEINFRAEDGDIGTQFTFVEQPFVELLLPCKVGYFSGDGDADCIPCGGPVACPTPFTREHCFVPFTVALPDDPTECVPCPAGGYLCKGGATAPDEGELVPAGYYRSEREDQVHPCPSGTLGLIPANRLDSCTRQPGEFIVYSEDKLFQSSATCPEGSSHPDDLIGSGVGLFSMEGYGSCISCVAGAACSGGRVPSTIGLIVEFLSASLPGRNHFSSYECNEQIYMRIYASRILGAYWLGGCKYLLNDCLRCPANKICPEGSMMTYSCPQGWYYDSSGEGQCLVCPLGYTCSSGQPVACSPGFYGAFVPQKNSRDCVACPQGYYCEGSALTIGAAKPCTAGFTCNASGLERPKVECPEGYYCPLGTAYSLGTPCPPGTWSNQKGLVSASQCKPVKAGAFSYEGETREDGSGKCAKGFYCPERSTTSMAVACPPGTYNSNEGGASLDDCLPCPAGKDCSTSGTSDPRNCPTSYYCPMGSSKIVPCPVGTYSDQEGLDSEEQCTQCPPGKFCSIASLAAPSGSCEPGFICHGGATTPTPTDGVTGEQCPPGGYCQAGATTVTPCLAGYYNPRWGAGSPSACLQCPPGAYCDGQVVSEGGVTGVCEEGQNPSARLVPKENIVETAVCFHHLESAKQGFTVKEAAPHQRPRRSQGRIKFARLDTTAPLAAQSLHRAALELIPRLSRRLVKVLAYLATLERFALQVGLPRLTASAPAATTVQGTYADQKGLEKCKECPPGYFCASTAKAPQESEKCPAGYFCPAGTASPHENPCPQGTMNANKGATSLEDCTACPAGHYCVGPAASVETGEVAGGYYSISGAMSSTPLPGCRILTAVTGVQKTACTGLETPILTFSDAAIKCLENDDCQGIVETPEKTFLLRCGNFSRVDDEKLSLFHPKHCTLGGMCKPGTYCPNGATKPEQCPKGSFCALHGLTAPSGKCAAGYICPEEVARKRQTAHHARQAIIATNKAFLRPLVPVQQAAQLLCHALTEQSNLKQEKHPVLAVALEKFAVKEAYKEKHALWDLHAQKGHRSKRHSHVPQGRIQISLAAARLARKAFTATHQRAIVLVDTARLDIIALPEPNGLSLRPFASMEKYVHLSRKPPKIARLIIFVTPLSWRNLRAPVVADSFALLGRPVLGQLGRKMPPPAMKICVGGLASKATTALAVSRQLPLHCGRFPISPTADYAESPLIAGTGFAGSGGDGLPGPETLLMLPANAIMDSTTGDIYLADYSNYAVKVVHGETGRNAIVEHDVALRSSALLSKISTQISKPLGLDIDADCSNLYIADSGNHRVVKHELAGTQATNTVIGTGTAGKSDTASNAAPTSFQLNMPSGVALHNGTVYVVDSGNKRVLEVNTNTNSVKELAGSHAGPSSGGASNPSEILFEKPVSAAVADQEGAIMLVVSDIGARALRKIDIQANTISTLVDYSTWQSPVADDANISIATTGLEEAFYGISSFYGEHIYLTVGRPRKPSAESARSGCTVAPLDLPNRRDRAVMATTALEDLSLLLNASALVVITALRIQDEEIFVIDLEEPTDLLGIRIQLGDKNPENLLGVDVKTENGCFTLCGHYAGIGGSTWSTPYATGSRRRHFPYRNKQAHRFIDNNGEELQGVKSIMLRFVPGSQTITAYASLTTKATRGGVTSASGCFKCSAGFACISEGVQVPCAEGYVCLEGSNTRTPEDNIMGYICPEGHYCPEGSFAEKQCPSGTFSSQGQGSCTPCSAGTYCLNPGSTRDGTNCPGKAGGTSCVECPAGKYCSGEGNIAPTGDCAPGYALKEVQSLVSALEDLCPIQKLMPLILAFHARGENTVGVLQKLGTALQGATEPQPCPAGSVRQATLGRFYCPTLSLVPEPCPAGHFCPLGSSEPRPCIGGTYNPHQEGSGTSSCLICLPGYLCPGEGNGELTKEDQCPKGHYCLEGSQQAIPCPPGTYADEQGLANDLGSGSYCPMEGSSEPGLACPEGYSCPLGTAVPRKCLQGTWCPAGSGEPQQCPPGALCPGTYSSEPGMTACQPCTAGYVCLEGCNSRTPTSKERDKGFRCAPGTYCPAGSSSETPCPAGTYGLQAASSSAEACYSCPGKEDLSDQDGVEPCQQTLYDECAEDAVRDSTGACLPSKEACSNQCGPAGGSFSTISGLCSCLGEKSLDEVCDETCRATRPQMILKDSMVLIDDPQTTSGDREFSLQDLTTQTGLATGSYECEDKAGCTVQMFDTTLAKMTGLVGVPQSFVDEVTERLQGYGIVPSVGKEEETEAQEMIGTAHSRRLASSLDFGYFGVSDPVQCLPLGSTVAWHIRPSPNPIYPVYLRNNLLNTNQQFDYGAFRELDTDMKGGEQRILFMFTFKEPGLYVFGLNSDQNKILILRVMEPRRLCREDALLPQLRTAETLAAIAARLPSTIETSGWLLFIAVVLGIILMAILLFVAAWTVKHQRLEKLEPDPKSKYNQRPPEERSTSTEIKEVEDLILQNQAQVPIDPKSKYNQRPPEERSTSTEIKEVEDLILQNQAQVPMEEDPGVLRARRALAKKLETQDPRLFIAVLNLAKQIQQETEQQNAASSAVYQQIWGKEHDEEREEILSTLLSLLRLRRRDLVNKLAREEKEHQEMEELLEEFRKARADADDDMPSIIEIYKARMKTLLEEAQGETNLALKSMLSADIEEHLMTGSALLELREARANLSRSEDEAEERKALEIYRVLAEAAWKLTVYTAVIEQEIASSTQAVNKAAFEGKQAVEIAKMDSSEAANALKASVMASLKEGRSRIQEAADAAEKAISSAEEQALSQLDSWTENYQAELRDMYDAIIDAQNQTVNSAFATESRLLKASMQTTKNKILEQIRNRYDSIHSLRCSNVYEELQVTLNASISERGLKTRQKSIDDAVNEVSNEVNRLRDAELESATATLNRIIASRTESVYKRQSAFKSRKLLMLQKRQELAVQQVPVQAQSAVALMRRGLHILTEQMKAATAYQATLFQNVAKFGVDMAALIKENTEDLSAPATLLDNLKTQQGEALAKYRDQLLACLRNQRQEATEELWDLELQERKRIAELLEDETGQLEVASNKLDEATAKEEAVRDEYENTVVKLRQQNQKGLKELYSIQALSGFKLKLFSKVDNAFLSRANEARSKGINDPDTDDKLQQDWRLARAELEPLICREKETYCRYTDLAFQTQGENAMRALQNSRQNRLSQAALTKSMEQAEEEGDDDMLNKRRALGTDEVQRIVWRICALLSSGGVPSADASKPHLVVPENKRDETIEELRQQLRRRRKRHLDYCMAQRNILEGRSKSALAVLQSETIQELSDTSEAIEGFSRGAATVDAADSSATILEVIKEAQKKLDEDLEEIQKEQEEAEKRDRVEREQEIAERKKAFELEKQKLNAEHEAKLAEVPEDKREDLIREHELAIKQMESAMAAELQEQEERTQQRLLERKQRLQQKRREAEQQKQKAVEQAKAELETKIAAEAKAKEEAAENDELQRLVNEGSNTTAVTELLARKHDRESSALLQELSMKKAEEISILTENFWKDKGGRICEGRPDDVQELYKAELQEYLFVQTQAPQMTEEEQYAKLQQEAEAAAAEEVGAIEKRMMEEQEKLLKEMEEKRNAYDKMLDKLKHRKQIEEKRRALRQEQEQRMREEGHGSGLKHLMSQFEEHRKLLEEALAAEADRQHKQARERVLLRNVDRSERLYQKRLVEKQRFLVNQNEIKRRELSLNNARAGVRNQRNLVETLNQQELKKRMELAHRLEEERHWAPIWREILEEEQNAGTFDSWDLDLGPHMARNP
ncbi:hypothetical protein, conserved [Eimeria praecox]|uniref:Chitin-binding type-2 domain-containing protein n=1 Tax=Eimeria praecox TaxID=51316 RepID=U6GVF5_9EIME|nr:hypothetical protein, conserved [Eimeria praecox]